jgi:hypothetical protein
MSTQPLFTPYRMGDLDLPNRIVMAPLTSGRRKSHMGSVTKANPGIEAIEVDSGRRGSPLHRLSIMSRKSAQPDGKPVGGRACFHFTFYHLRRTTVAAEGDHLDNNY